MSKGILTKREKEVFSLLIENKTTREIANILSISEKYSHIWWLQLLRQRTSLENYIKYAYRTTIIFIKN